MNRKKRNEDPAYLQLMREAKELFDAEMAKAAMKRKGRPPKTAVKAVAVDVDDDDLDLGHTAEHEVVIPPPPPPAAKKAPPRTAKKAAKKR